MVRGGFTFARPELWPVSGAIAQHYFFQHCHLGLWCDEASTESVLQLGLFGAKLNAARRCHVAGLAGRSAEADAVYAAMCAARVAPNDYTFSGLITAHSLAGAGARKALELRREMVRLCGIPLVLLTRNSQPPHPSRRL